MTPSLICAVIWLVAAGLTGLRAARPGHWALAGALIAAGVPLSGWITVQNGPWIGLAMLLAGALVLRWPPSAPRRDRRLLPPGE
ncbi:hypothetical protein OCGS_0435 [Oceaniovalibus guishaninsula JLT2003]|uniref:DUF2484 family protein n=1 Tax=Oceaniovalibus guishaninsula JLT2003 TaxID=1231392 RepID=K2I8G9_9RHOB|nr:DUF2484 family protein [Oceaniovalibus guishaninsula]EKE45345.1 hypothetical protein OCGS_0435 [Oceaniovalibus guishaninsula JLT2003]